MPTALADMFLLFLDGALKVPSRPVMGLSWAVSGQSCAKMVLSGGASWALEAVFEDLDLYLRSFDLDHVFLNMFMCQMS